MTSDLLEENADLRKQSEQMKQRIAALEKACDETQELLDKQIEATYKLYKENAELKNKIEHRNCLDCSNHSSNLRMRNLDLEKENAKLKSRECWKSCEYANPKSELIGQHIKDVQQLTKAKEIIKELMSFSVQLCDCRHTVDFEKTREEAEQFLKDSEVEK